MNLFCNGLGYAMLRYTSAAVAVIFSLGSIARAIEAHPTQVVGQWVTEPSPSVTYVFGERGSLKRLRESDPVAENGYWEQTAEGRLRIKWLQQEAKNVSYAIDGEIMRITTDEGDTFVHHRVHVGQPIPIEGTWLRDGKATWEAESHSLTFLDDNTFAGVNKSPASAWPVDGRGVWKWLENDFIEFTAPELKVEKRWKVKHKDGELKFISSRGEVVIFLKPKVIKQREESANAQLRAEAQKPKASPAASDELASVESMRRVRAQQLEAETRERIRLARLQLSSNPAYTKDMLQETQLLVEKSDDLRELTRQSLLSEIDDAIRDAIRQSQMPRKR
jgi:hypothetical protein